MIVTIYVCIDFSLYVSIIFRGFVNVSGWVLVVFAKILLICYAILTLCYGVICGWVVWHLCLWFSLDCGVRCSHCCCWRTLCEMARNALWRAPANTCTTCASWSSIRVLMSMVEIKDLMVCETWYCGLLIILLFWLWVMWLIKDCEVHHEEARPLWPLSRRGLHPVKLAYASSPDNRAHCYTELVVSSPVWPNYC